MKTIKIKNLLFNIRENTSDLKAIEEVINSDVYQKRGNKILPHEKWIDCGGNVGAFTVLAASRGAKVIVYEPDPNNCKMIEMNLRINNLDASIKNFALVHDDRKMANLFVGNNGNLWRNSLYKNWNGKGLKVNCKKFDDEIENGCCVKIDIEGAEMPILETTERLFKKLIFEWSFDIDPSLQRFWNIVDKLKTNYEVKFEEHRTCYDDKREVQWKKSWFPACTNVFCYEKN